MTTCKGGTSIPLSECGVVVESKKSRSPLSRPFSNARGSEARRSFGEMSAGLSMNRPREGVFDILGSAWIGQTVNAAGSIDVPLGERDRSVCEAAESYV